jgi:transcriptional regulator with XRE-family HTH domain
MKQADEDKQKAKRMDREHGQPPLSIGEYIRRAREQKGISGRRLAATINMHHGYLARLEAGDYKRPSPEILERIAAALNLPYDDLFAITGQHAPSGLPGFVPYIRAKYEVDDETLLKLNAYFNRLREEHKIRERADRFQVKDYDGPLPDIDVHAV